MRVVCVNAGNYLGRGKEYVEKLHNTARRNLSSDFTFECFTDDAANYANGITKRPLVQNGLHGWWNKLSLFKPGVFDDGEQVLFIDLDTVIVRPIDDIASYRGRFAMLGPFFSNVSPMFSGAQSGLMSWQGGFGAEIWNAFEAAGCPPLPGGDQRFINMLQLEPDLWQVMFPGSVVSFKGTGGVHPDAASVVCFHGIPRPHQCGGWVKEMWV